jgi:hypothetical protein
MNFLGKKYRHVSVLVVFLVLMSIFSSTNFIVRDPVVGAGGGYQSSGSFKMYGSNNLTTSGQGSSANFIGRAGFLYFPHVVEGVLDAVLNGIDVDLDWTATDTALGFNVSDYEVGIATVTGGPYTYTSVGIAFDYTYSALEPDDYFFVVRTLDGLGNPIALSNEETITVPQLITFSISDNTIGFSSVNSASARFATGDTTGSASDTSAHNMQIATNAPSGYSISYSGTSLSGPETITDAVITNDADGSPSSKQFAVGFSTDGGATITSSYDHNPTPGSRDWKFTTSDLIATEATPTATQTISAFYLANVSATTSAGAYGGVITYVATANF